MGGAQSDDHLGPGFIGSTLAHRLVMLGANILILDSLIPSHGGNLTNIVGIEDRIQVDFADLRSVGNLDDLIQDREAIFNLAGQTSHLGSMDDPFTDLEINCACWKPAGGTIPASKWCTPRPVKSTAGRRRRSPVLLRRGRFRTAYQRAHHELRLPVDGQDKPSKIFADHTQNTELRAGNHEQQRR